MPQLLHSLRCSGLTSSQARGSGPFTAPQRNSPALTLPSFAHTDGNDSELSSGFANGPSQSSSSNILNHKDTKLGLKALQQIEPVTLSHLDFSFLSFHSSCTAAAGMLTAVGSITLLMMCLGTDVSFASTPPLLPAFGAE